MTAVTTEHGPIRESPRCGVHHRDAACFVHRPIRNRRDAACVVRCSDRDRRAGNNSAGLLWGIFEGVLDGDSEGAELIAGNSRANKTPIRAGGASSGAIRGLALTGEVAA